MHSMRRAALAALAVAIGAALAIGPAPTFAHPEPTDVDGDAVVNAADNCPTVFNADQAPGPAIVPGNRCNPRDDSDGDGVPDWRDQPPDYPRLDNCRSVPNADQTPSSKPGAQGVGAACDADSDGDGVLDEVPDNCPLAANPLQGNIDRDDLGDACDPDLDSDTRPNEADNCPTVYNLDQADRDGDGRGTVCDASESVGPAPGTDRRPPAVTLRIARRRRFEEVRGGLVVRVRCDEACAVTAELVLDRRRAARMKLGRTGVVAGGSAEIEAAGTTYVFVKFTRPARRALLRQRRVALTLRTVVLDRAGNRRRLTRALTLTR